MPDIEKGNGDIVRVQVNEFKEKKYLDIRNFFMSEDDYAPTKKGISVPLELKDKLIEAIKEAIKEG